MRASVCSGFKTAVAFDAFDHVFARSGHQPDFVEQRLPVGLDQDGRLDDDRVASHLSARIAATISPIRVNIFGCTIALSRLSAAGSANTIGPSLLPVNRAVGSEDAFAKSGDQSPGRRDRPAHRSRGRLCRRRLRGRRVRQNFSRGAFSRADSACESDGNWFHGNSIVTVPCSSVHLSSLAGWPLNWLPRGPKTGDCRGS